MNNTEIDLFQFRESKNSFTKCLQAIIYAFVTWLDITLFIWFRYTGNWLNYYQATSYMVMFIVMIFFAIYITHYLNFRFITYIILGIFSILFYLNGVNSKIPIIDIIVGFLIKISNNPQNAAAEYENVKFLIGDSLYEALLTWVIIDVPFQMWENKQYKEWETSVKYVYHTISNQIMFFELSNHNTSAIHVQNNKVHCKKIESFCKKRIKSYSERLLYIRKDTPSYETNTQIIKQYKRLVELLNDIRSNPNQLDEHEYLKLLYEAEAMFRHSKIICDD